ncbi:MmyB family transcriptional regulator [Streptomyces sp. NPDC002004]
MAYEAPGYRPAPGITPEKLAARDDREARAYLEDYSALLEAVPFPSVVFDHCWDVVLANSAFDALFRGVGPHPSAMPHDNFLRFVLFHPDAGTVLAEHESSWCLPMLAHFAEAVRCNGQDHGLRSIRQEIARDPIMDAAYRQGLPRWIRAAGADAVAHDGAVRPLWHPDPRWGRTSCRVVGETPRTLQELGYTRMTLVLREPRRVAGPARRRVRRGGGHLRAVPATDI